MHKSVENSQLIAKCVSSKWPPDMHFMQMKHLHPQLKKQQQQQHNKN